MLGRLHKVSPAAARLLREHPSLSVETLRASGPKGHLLKTDVLRALGVTPPITPVTPPPAVAAPVAAPVAAVSAVVSHRAGKRAVGAPPTFETVPLSAVRRVIASRLTASKQSLPHAYVSRECSLEQVLALRKRLKDAARPSVPSVSDFITRAAAIALRRVPAVNVVRQASGAVAHSPTVDVAFAVSVDGAPGKPFSGSLLTPIVARADRLSVSEIAARSKELVEKARSGKLKPAEYQGGSFCISNLGMFGITSFTAIINAPQSAILAVGAPIERVRADRSVGTSVTVTLSIDNSAIEHDEAARWLDEFALHLEEPALL
jgi:pyruvate/2-oxoglutarate dehydrogenase complex dihydrolipoamide acyltransferase (E2) component